MNPAVKGAMIRVEGRGPVAILHMTRGKGNALDIEFAAALEDALARIEGGPARAAVITGEGRIFCAGVDLPALVSGGPAYIREFFPRLARLFERLARFPKPLVAAANGHAIAGGAILLLSCDLRLMVRSGAQVGLTETLVGVRPPVWALEIARFSTPPQHFSELLLSGRTWPPEDALSRGLVDELSEPAHLLDRACEAAGAMAAMPAAAFASAKRALRQPLIESAQRRSEAEDAATLERWCSAETLADIERFVSTTFKRPHAAGG